MVVAVERRPLSVALGGFRSPWAGRAVAEPALGSGSGWAGRQSLRDSSLPAIGLGNNQGHTQMRSVGATIVVLG